MRNTDASSAFSYGFRDEFEKIATPALLAIPLLKSIGVALGTGAMTQIGSEAVAKMANPAKAPPTIQPPAV